MTTTMATTSRAQLFSDAETGLFSRHGANYSATPMSNGENGTANMNGNQHGSKCFCCPYGYHIDLDFVRYCENWQTMACDKIARGNEEKRRRRARQKQCQSMEFLLGLPDDKEYKPEPAPVPVTKPTPPKPPPKPNVDSIKLNKDWQDTLSNFEEALSQSYTGPSSSACSTPIDNRYLSSTYDSRSSSQNGEAAYQPLKKHHQNQEPVVPPLPSSSRLVLRSYTASPEPPPPPPPPQQQLILEDSSSRGGENRPCLQSIREQMAAALERMKQLEEQVKEIPLLHVQMSVLREERRILLRQLASQRKINNQPSPAPVVVSKRDVGVCCGVVTRDIGVCHQQTKTRETSTNTQPRPEHRTRSTATDDPPSPEARKACLQSTKGTQCSTAQLLSKSVQCLPEPRQSRSTQCETEPVRPLEVEAKAVQCSVETRDRGTLSLKSLLLDEKPTPVIKKNKEVQATESQPWVKLKLSMGVMAKPSLSDAATETTDASISLATLRRRQTGSRSVGVNVARCDLLGCVSRSTETLAPRIRDFGTSPQRKLLVDVSVGASLPSVTTGSTNYCDECKQISKSAKAAAVEGRSRSSSKSRIPVMTEPAKNERRTTLIRQDTWTESLDQLGDGSQSLEHKYAERVLAGSQSSLDKQQQQKKNNVEKNEIRRDSYAKLDVGEIIISPDSEEAEKTKELDDALVTSMVLETPKISGQRPPMELSKEMKAALKVLDDNLSSIHRKVSAGGTLPSRVKNASNIVQHEWFKISSTAQADPLGVEFYLDQFEQHSSSLLGHVVNLTDSSGNTAMHYAVSHGNFDVVSILIDSKVCDVNRSNHAGYTPVMLAALAQVRNSTHASVVKRLFQMADVNVRARLHGQTALMLAVSHGRKDMSRLLLEAGAAVNLQDEDGSTALMCAAEHGHADIVRLLLSQPDCDSNIVDVDGSSALKIALEAGHADIGVLLYAHQRANRASPMPPAAALPLPRPSSRRQRTSSGHHHGHSGGQQQYSALSMSAPASPVATASRKFHSSSLSLVDSPKYSL
ncbi:KN motif and ankyrin repeat domain-containing protein 2-like isoform X1 [Nasonia vitripennis]|uniref:Kank n=1 Tax=Nasonia vitripennis TaxID=7425 RepID=A0A7M7QXD2_NASVI|nr:KN motif and ankyrin repeat domain-containing protein 2-like isoform X1 [Nasonia vitripennis]